jgi:hypothetical protein
MKLMIWSAILAVFAAGFLVIVAQAQPSYSHLCDRDFVPREAYFGDDTCVRPEIAAQVAYENEHACENVDPDDMGGVLYDGCGDTCLPDHVWRLTNPNDHVCVTPGSRQQTIYDNSRDQVLIRAAHKYSDPKWFSDGYRLDWCLYWGEQCGQPAADKFCRFKRYTGARSFVQDPNIGASKPTITSGNYITRDGNIASGSYQVCDQSLCNGFKSITCYGQIWYTRVYGNPEWYGHNLDVCLYGNSDCGKPAADEYCRQQGWTKSFYNIVDSAPSDIDTITIHDAEVYHADDHTLYDFKMIICQ